MGSSIHKTESSLNPVLKDLLNLRSGAVIDVGANTGQTLQFIVSIDRTRRYVGFEPQISACAEIEQFILSESLTDHIIFPLALSNKRDIATLYARGDGIESLKCKTASVITGFRPAEFYNTSSIVYTLPGDQILANLSIDEIAFIKIDVEGAELEVLEGLADTIERFRPAILFEVLHHYLSLTNEEISLEAITFREERIQRLVEFIKARDYSIFQIHGGVSLIEVDDIRPARAPDIENTNYLALPAEINVRQFSNLA